VLNDLAAKNPEKLDWKRSIVDLMKLLDLDSSLAARKALAQELHYTGNTNDSATMNVWLHKQVMVKLAENGGKVPEELKG
jgi:HEAT repeat protein